MGGGGAQGCASARGLRLSRIFDGHAASASQTYPVYNHVVWTPFIFAATRANLPVLKYLATRYNPRKGHDVDVHWRSLGGNNAYANALKTMEDRTCHYEQEKGCFPDPDIFDDVRPGETHAQYVARRREEVEAKYAPVLASPSVSSD